MSLRRFIPTTDRETLAYLEGKLTALLESRHANAPPLEERIASVRDAVRMLERRNEGAKQ